MFGSTHLHCNGWLVADAGRIMFAQMLSASLKRRHWELLVCSLVDKYLGLSMVDKGHSY